MNILDAAGQIGLALKKVSETRGGEWAGPCPKCGGTDRFRVWPADKGGGGSYWCRQPGNGCGAWGDLVQFLVDFCGYAYRDAFTAAGREMPASYGAGGQGAYWNGSGPGAGTNGGKPKFRPRVFEYPSEVWQEKAGALVEEAHAALLENDRALAWLDRRGLDLGAVKGFRLGWFEGDKGLKCRFRPRESWGIPRVLKADGKPKMLWIPRGLVIPCFKDKEIYRIRIRRPSEDLKREADVKYYIIPGSGMDAMGIHEDRAAIVVVESELDGMLVARRAGSLAGAVALGSAVSKPGAAVYPMLEKALRILVALDYDKAGISAWNWWNEQFRSARPWPVPEGKDPGEAFEKGVDIRDWILSGLPPALAMDMDSRAAYEIPDGVPPFEELRMLLSRYPVEIDATPDRAEIRFEPGFRSPAVQERIKALFFGDEELHWYLRIYHPDPVIHGGNCFFHKGGDG